MLISCNRKQIFHKSAVLFTHALPQPPKKTCKQNISKHLYGLLLPASRSTNLSQTASAVFLSICMERPKKDSFTEFSTDINQQRVVLTSLTSGSKAARGFLFRPLRDCFPVEVYLFLEITSLCEENLSSSNSMIPL